MGLLAGFIPHSSRNQLMRYCTRFAPVQDRFGIIETWNFPEKSNFEA